MSAAPSLGEFEQVVLLAILRLRDDAYGVAIGAEITACTRREPAPGALYTTLDRLEDKGLVTSRLGDPTPQRGGRAKRYFVLNAKGLAAITGANNPTGVYWRLRTQDLLMHTVNIAEWILALVTAPDRAASTVESDGRAAARGMVWFGPVSYGGSRPSVRDVAEPRASHRTCLPRPRRPSASTWSLPLSGRVLLDFHGQRSFTSGLNRLEALVRLRC